jgi:very-short-patch-repair endonuclease
MAGQSVPSSAWALAHSQHGVVTRRQLLELGFSARAIEHRLTKGRLHPVYRGVFAVGRPELTEYGRWMAAVLSCGPAAALSHEDAAALFQIRAKRRGPIEVSVPRRSCPRRPGLVVHRRTTLARHEITRHRGIPVTSPTCTLIDLAIRLPSIQVEAMISEADKRGLVHPERLRRALDELPGRAGAGVLRKLLDVRTFVLSDSDLERLFLPIARSAGLPKPLTRCRVNGFRVDFYWPDISLVVETDGLRYHRTAQQQARDSLRNQVHAACGLTPLRFTHGQIAFEQGHVEAILTAVGRRLVATSHHAVAH